MNAEATGSCELGNRIYAQKDKTTQKFKLAIQSAANLAGGRMTALDFIPGTLCDERMWSRLIPLLGGDFSFNHVPLHEARSRLEMKQLIATHTEPAANVVAFSLGAYLAIEHAVAHPERVRSLVLIANSARGLKAEEVLARERIVAMLERNAYAGMSRQRLRELLHASHLDDESIVGPIQQMALDLSKEVLLTQFATTIDRPDLMDRLSALGFPVLIVGAEDDNLVPREDLEQMAANFPNAVLHMLGGDTGHMIPLEAPQSLAGHMQAFYANAGII
jgi:pimeloyl-ACP methyl ester carboxylesterase